MRLSFPRKIASVEAIFRGSKMVCYDVCMPLIYSITLVYGVQFAVTHALLEYFSLYWRYSWIDVPMHILGGVFLMLIVGSFTVMRVLSRRFIDTPLFVVLMVGVLLVWEVFGIWRYGGLKPDFWTDSTVDLICGVIGLGIGYYLVRALRFTEITSNKT